MKRNRGRMGCCVCCEYVKNTLEGEIGMKQAEKRPKKVEFKKKIGKTLSLN